MLELRCADISFANCADGDPGSDPDCGGEERSAELDRDRTSPTPPDWRRVAIAAIGDEGRCQGDQNGLCDG